MRKTPLFLVLALTLFSSVGFSINYKALKWIPVGEAELAPNEGEVHTFEIDRVRGKFVRIEFNRQCGHFGYALFAEAVPYNPGLIFDRNFIEYTPFTTSHYFYARQLGTFQFTKVQMELSSHPTFPCEVRVAVANAK